MGKKYFWKKEILRMKKEKLEVINQRRS